MQATARVALILLTLVSATLAAGCTGADGAAAAGCTLDERAMPARAPPDHAANETVILEITRDHGTEAIKRVNATVEAGDSVLDVLMRHAEVETAYGGGFVKAIDGIESRFPDAQVDWFFEVDGHTAMVGAADVDVAAGDHVHWDYRTWGPAQPPGHFNSFPWSEADGFYTSNVQLPPDASVIASPWNGSWPDGPATLTATPGEAPWDIIPWATEDSGALTACGRTFEAPWTLVARADPTGSQRALFVADARLDVTDPGAGHAWIHHDGTTYEVELP